MTGTGHQAFGASVHQVTGHIESLERRCWPLPASHALSQTAIPISHRFTPEGDGCEQAPRRSFAVPLTCVGPAITAREARAGTGWAKLRSVDLGGVGTLDEVARAALDRALRYALDIVY